MARNDNAFDRYIKAMRGTKSKAPKRSPRLVKPGAKRRPRPVQPGEPLMLLLMGLGPEILQSRADEIDSD